MLLLLLVVAEWWRDSAGVVLLVVVLSLFCLDFLSAESSLLSDVTQRFFPDSIKRIPHPITNASVLAEDHLSILDLIWKV